MFLPSPSSALFVLFSFCTVSDARVLNRRADEHVQDGKGLAHTELRRGLKDGGVFAKRQEEELDCSQDRFSEFLNANPEERIETFCNEWLGIEPATLVVEYTPTMFVSR